jgi:hypothetical protein
MAYKTLNLNPKQSKSIIENDSEDGFSENEEDFVLEQDSEEDFEDAPVGDTDDTSDLEGEDDDLYSLETEEEVEEAEEETEETEADEEDEDLPASKRENDRIRSLNEKAKLNEKLAYEEKKKRIEAEKKMVEFQTTTVETNKKQLKNLESSLKTRLKKAQEEGNSDEVVELTDQLMEVKQDLSMLEQWKAPVVEEIEDEATFNKRQSAISTPEEAPKAAQKWLAKNPWFQNPVTAKDRERIQEALFYNNKLTQQGMTYDDPEFYELMDARLSSLGLAPKTKGNVNLNKDKDSSERRKKQSENANTSNEPSRKKISQTVKGASRHVSAKKSSQKNKIVLSKEQQEIAELYGMTNREYALELRKIEEAEKKGSRMVTL